MLIYHFEAETFFLDFNIYRDSPKKVFLSENMIFGGFRLFLYHFGQQAPESPVSLLQNCVSTSSLPPFIVDLLTFKDYAEPNSFFQWEFQRVLNGKHHKQITMGRNSTVWRSYGYFCSCFEIISKNRRTCHNILQQRKDSRSILTVLWHLSTCLRTEQACPQITSRQVVIIIIIIISIMFFKWICTRA